MTHSRPGGPTPRAEPPNTRKHHQQEKSSLELKPHLGTVFLALHTLPYSAHPPQNPIYLLSASILHAF